MPKLSALNYFACIGARWQRDRSGAVVVLFALVAAALSVLVAGGIEVHRRNLALNQLQVALDSAVLAGKQRQVATGAKANNADGNPGITMAKATFGAHMANSKFFTNPPVATFRFNAQEGLEGSASPTFNMIFSPLLPASLAQLKTFATAENAIGVPTEVALVLDSTTSMLNMDARAETRLTLLRNSSKEFVHRLFDAAQASNNANLVRVSVIPFATTVNLLGGAPLAADFTGKTPVVSMYDGGSLVPVSNPLSRTAKVSNPNPSDFDPVTWRGCVSGAGDDSGYTDNMFSGSLRALAVPAVPDTTNYVDIGVMTPTTISTCTCTRMGEDGLPCWTPGRQGFLDQIKRSVPQIQNAAMLLNPDIGREGTTRTDKSCMVCLETSCTQTAGMRVDCSAPIRRETFQACNTWDFYGRQAAYRPRPRPNCVVTWNACYTEEEFAAAERGRNPCIADPSEPAQIRGTVEWCAPYNDGNQWTRDIRIAGPNMNCVAPMLGLSGNRRQVIEYIDRLHPVPGGTHMDVGLRWGLRTLSPNNGWPAFFGLTRAPGTFGTGSNKIMVLITDGENERAIDYPGYWGCEGMYGPGLSAAQPACLGSPDVTELNTRMTRWCDAARQTYGINIYAVSINVPGAASLARLTQCTGDSAKVFNIDAADLSSVLATIGSKIAAMKLVK